MRSHGHPVRGVLVLLVLFMLATALAACGSSSTKTSTPDASARSARVGSSTDSGVADAASYPATIKAANGSVTVPSKPHAIISLSPTATEILYAIGAGSQVKAVDRYSDYPAGTPTTKLDAAHPNVEAIAKEQPDLVIVASDAAGFDHQMALLHIPVLSEPAAATLDMAFEQYAELGKATGHVAAARAEVAKVRSQLARIVASVPASSRGGTYYYELDQTYYSATSATFIGGLLSLLGLRSIADGATGAASSGGYPQLSAEYIVKADPTYIVLADTICCGASASSVAERPGFAGLAAVTKHHIVALNDDIASRWGPRVTVLLEQIAGALGARAASSSS